MTFWLVSNTIRHALRRLVLEAIGVAFPVAMLAATMLFVDDAVQAMTPAALGPVQIEMRAVAKSLDVDIAKVSRQLAAIPDVQAAEPFAATNVIVAPGPAGTPGQVTARLFAVGPHYMAQHPWVRVVKGGLDGGVLLDQAVRAWPRFESATSVSISLPGDSPPLSLAAPVGGTVDLRQATTWFAIPYGDVQGDIVTVPRAIMIDYATFERSVLPVLRDWASKGGLPPFDPGSSELPAASLESHITVDHAAYPPDPGLALTWSAGLQRRLERGAAGYVYVADNAAEALGSSRDDATNAKILFLLLGLPGVLVAAGVGLAAAAALVEAHRREEALLRLRGATGGEIARLAATQAAVAGFVGSVLGLLIAVASVSAITGRPVWQGVPPRDLGLAALLAVAAGALTTLVRLFRLWRASRRSEVAFERRLLQLGWAPIWRRARLDMVAIVIGVAILVIDYISGGLNQSPIEGTTLALAFYILLAPIAIWIGATLLVIRGLLALLTRWARPERAGPLPSWRGAALLWLGRRPAQTGSALALGALAVAFGTYVLTFAATYETAKQSDAQAAIGSDLRLTPGDPRFTLPALGPGIDVVSAFRLVPARVGSDRKTILALDLPAYLATVTKAPSMLAGQGPEGLATDPEGVLIASEIAADFSVGPGDPLPLTIFPDDFESSKDLNLHVIGVFSSFPPTSPPAELVATAAALPRAQLVPPDFYLARVHPGRPPEAIASDLNAGALAEKFAIASNVDQSLRGLTALNLDGLSRLETFGADLAAALGVAVLGAFLVLERRREMAILRSLGADTRQILTGPVLEGSIAALGSLAIGVPIGIVLGILAVRILRLFFTLPPPLVTVPATQLAGLALFMLGASAIALGAALVAIERSRLAAILKGQ
jgi:putative ABC transport system permease protein